MGHFTARSLHSLKPSVTSQPIQNKFNFTSVTSQSIIYLQVCVVPGVLFYVVNLISILDNSKKIVMGCEIDETTCIFGQILLFFV